MGSAWKVTLTLADIVRDFGDQVLVVIEVQRPTLYHSGGRNPHLNQTLTMVRAGGWAYDCQPRNAPRSAGRCSGRGRPFPFHIVLIVCALG